MTAGKSLGCWSSVAHDNITNFAVGALGVGVVWCAVPG